MAAVDKTSVSANITANTELNRTAAVNPKLVSGVIQANAVPVSTATVENLVLKKELTPLRRIPQLDPEPEEEKERTPIGEFYADVSEVLTNIGDGLAEAQRRMDISAVRAQKEILDDDTLSGYGLTANWFVMPEAEFTMKLDFSMVAEETEEGKLEGKPVRPRLMAAVTDSKYTNLASTQRKEQSSLRVRFVPVPMPALIKVPNVVGMTVDAARMMLSGASVNSFFIDKDGKGWDKPNGYVQSQSVDGGNVILAERTLILLVEKKKHKPKKEEPEDGEDGGAPGPAEEENDREPTKKELQEQAEKEKAEREQKEKEEKELEEKKKQEELAAKEKEEKEKAELEAKKKQEEEKKKKEEEEKKKQEELAAKEKAEREQKEKEEKELEAKKKQEEEEKKKKEEEEKKQQQELAAKREADLLLKKEPTIAVQPTPATELKTRSTLIQETVVPSTTLKTVAPASPPQQEEQKKEEEPPVTKAAATDLKATSILKKI